MKKVQNGKFNNIYRVSLLSCLLVAVISCGKTKKVSEGGVNTSDAGAGVLEHGNLTDPAVTMMKSVSILLTVVRTGDSFKAITNLTGTGTSDLSEKFSMYYCKDSAQEKDCVWESVSGLSFTREGDSRITTTYLPSDIDLSSGKKAWVRARYCDQGCDEVSVSFEQKDLSVSKSSSSSKASDIDPDADTGDEFQTN